MEVKKTSRDEILISGVKNLDPITVIFRDFEPGKGQIIVACFDRAWVAYWGAMGNDTDLRQFIRGADVDYLAQNLVRGTSDVITRHDIQVHEELYVERIARTIKDALSLEPQKKRRTPKASTPGFDAFWAAWPTSPRKVNKQACLTRWVRAGIECRASEIVSHVEACKVSRDWLKNDGEFIPAPLTYLNQERYLAPPPQRANQAGSLAGISYSKDGIEEDGSFT